MTRTSEVGRADHNCESFLTGGGNSPSADGAVSSVQVGASAVHSNGLDILVHLNWADQLDHGNVVLQSTPVPTGVLWMK